MASLHIPRLLQFISKKEKNPHEVVLPSGKTIKCYSLIVFYWHPHWLAAVWCPAALSSSTQAATIAHKEVNIIILVLTNLSSRFWLQDLSWGSDTWRN